MGVNTLCTPFTHACVKNERIIFIYISNAMTFTIAAGTNFSCNLAFSCYGRKLTSLSLRVFICCGLPNSINQFRLMLPPMMVAMRLISSH